jgi:peptide/nickel transport system substrate-binding protein
VGLRWPGHAVRGHAIIRKNPRKLWYSNLKEVQDQRRHRGHLRARPAAALVPVDARGGYSPVYACHVPDRVMRSKPIGTGPFKVVDFKRNESIKLVRNPGLLEEGQARISTRSTGRSCPTAARACSASSPANST